MNITRLVITVIDKGARKIREFYYIHYNRFLLSIYGVKFGKNPIIRNKAYFDIKDGARLSIGDNFEMTSGEGYNPLCRNIRASIYLERPNSIVTIGDNCGISSSCIWAKQSISIGHRVKIGGDCMLMDSDAHNLDFRIRGNGVKFGYTSQDVLTSKCAPIVIEDDVLIGARSIILKGVTVGARSVVAAGSVVTKNIPSDCIAGGNPCRVIRLLK